jgi:hypothetical protein
MIIVLSLLSRAHIYIKYEPSWTATIVSEVVLYCTGASSKIVSYYS